MRNFATLFSLLIFATSAHSITVTTLIDENDPAGAGGDVSLREAIRDVPSGGTIDFDSGLSGGVIELSHSTNFSAHLDVFRPMTIDASALPNGITIRGDRTERIFFVQPLPQGLVEMKRLRIEDGDAGGSWGGAVYCGNNGDTISWTMRLTECHITDCFADSGGAIHTDHNIDLTLSRCSLIKNGARETGGALHLRGAATISNSTIACNRVDRPIGEGYYTGGAIYTISSLQLLQSTITRNWGTEAVLVAQAGTLTLSHTICAANALYPFRTDGGSISSNGYNLIGGFNSPPAYAVSTDILDNDPQLLEPMRRGGITYTCAFRPTSPACDAGDPSIIAPPATDQRGFARLRDGDGFIFGGAEIDIGAYELGETITVTTEEDENGGIVNTGTSLREALAQAAIIGPGTRITFGSGVAFIKFGSEFAIDTPLWIDDHEANVTAGVRIGNSRFYRVSPGIVASITGTSIGPGRASIGAGIKVDSGAHLNLTDSSVAFNEATSHGGGIYIDRGSGYLLRCDFQVNKADSFGGGVYVDGKLECRSCRFILNSAVIGGGAISDNGDDEITLENCTVIRNTSGARGAGLDVAATNPRVSYSVFAGNTITPSDSPANFFGDTGTVISTELNAEDGSGMFTGIDDLTNIDPALDEFGRPIPFESPLIDRGPTQAGFDGCYSTDLLRSPRITRGAIYPLPLDPRLDIGAIESAETFVVDTPFDESDGPSGGLGTSLRDAIALANALPAVNAIAFSPFLLCKTIQLESAHGGQLRITDTVSICGPGSHAEALCVRGSGAGAATPFRVLEVDADDVDLELLTFEDGDAGAGAGGNIRISNSDLTRVRNCIVRRGRAADGGGISVFSTDEFELEGCTVVDNTATENGGGLYHNSSSGSVVLRRSTFELDLSTLPLDMDGDCVPNADEVTMGWDPTDPSDGLADSDGDGQSDGKEWVAATDRNDRTSLLELLSVQNISANRSYFQITWSSVPGVIYEIYFSEDLNNWARVGSGITASGPTKVDFATTPPNLKRLFFEVRAVRP